MTYRTTKRDNIVYAVANFVINVFASKHYKAFIYAIIKQGKKSFDNGIFYTNKYKAGSFHLPNVTRITVVIKGRELEKWDLKNVELHVQDDGKTLKVFAREQEKF